MYSVLARRRPAAFLFFSALLIGSFVFQFSHHSQAAGNKPGAKNAPISLARDHGFVDGVSVAAPNDSRLLKFQPGRDLRLDGVVGALRTEGVVISTAFPLSLATDDIDGDGYPDLICGYASASGGLLLAYFCDSGAYPPSSEDVLRGFR